VLEGGIVEWGQRVLSSLGSEAAFDLRNPLVREFLDAWEEQHIVGITDTARGIVTDTLKKAADEGVGIDEAKRRLREKFEDMTGSQAERIARTEVVGSSNAANLAAYQISGLVDEKEWLAVSDEQTRETHADMDGQRRKLDEPFTTPTGLETQGPGLFGRPEEDINCRCTVRPIVDVKAGVDRREEWRRYVADLDPFERKTRAAVAGVYGKWLGDAIAAL